MMPIADTIVARVGREALRAPDALAILAPGRAPLTYRALMHRIDGASKALAAAGFGQGHRVGLALPDGPEMAVALLGVTAGASCVPLNPALDEASCVAAMRTLRIDAMIVPQGVDTSAGRAARSLSLPILRLAFSPQDPAGTFTLDGGASRTAATISAPAPEDVAIVLQTSGTTARPKVVPLTHRLLVEPSLARARRMGLTGADRCLCVTPLFTASGIRRSLLPVLMTGGSVICTPGLQVASFFAWLEEFQPTFYIGSPAVHRAVLDELDRRGGAPRTALRFIGTGSSALPVELECRLESAFGVPVIQAYATTEAGLIAQNPLPPGRRRAGSAGLPAGNEFTIQGHAGESLPPGEAGEIVVRGPEVFGGYEDDPEANRDAFRDGWFRTGDLGYVDRDGFLFIAGRLKELINRGGFKVPPSAVDAALMRHPAIVDAATFAVPHRTLGEDVVTAVVLRISATVTAHELRDFAFRHLDAFMVPSQIVPVSKLPRTALGKIQRDELVVTLRQHLRADFMPPRDANEELVAGLFSEVLGIDSIGAFDNFFMLGGDSLQGARLVQRANSTLGSNLDVARLFRRPTVAEFASELAAVGRAGPPTVGPPLEPQRRSVYRPATGGTKPP